VASYWTWSGNAFSGLDFVEPISIPGSLGGLVRGWKIRRRGEGRRTIIYLHGNAGNIATYHRVLLYQMLAEAPLSCDVVTIDYGGLGRSDGYFPTEETAIQDALATYDHVAATTDPSNIVIWGHSLGTGITTGLLSRLASSSSSSSAPPASPSLPFGFILEAPFTAAPDVPLRRLKPWLPNSVFDNLYRLFHWAFQKNLFASDERIASISAKLPRGAVLHGTQDDVVPFELGKELSELGHLRLVDFDRRHDDIIRDQGNLTRIVMDIFNEWDQQVSRP